jgi:hypothetical protein
LPTDRLGLTVNRVRWGIAVVLVVLAALLAPAALVARYVRGELLDTDRYVETVGPLADDRAVQRAVVDLVAREVVDFLAIEEGDGLARDALQDLGLAGPLAGQVEEVTRDELTRVVETDEFADLWVRANRVAHRELEAVLTGESDTPLEADPDAGRVDLDLGEVVDRLRDRLVEIGLDQDLVDRIPDVDARLTVLQSDRLAETQRTVRLLDRVGTVLPVVVVVLLVAAVAVAPDRRRAVLVAGVGVTVAMVLLAAGLVLAREWYLDSATPRSLPPDAAGGFARVMLDPLRTALAAVFVVGLVAAVVALAAGPSGPARAVRRALGRDQGRDRDGRPPDGPGRPDRPGPPDRPEPTARL